LERFCHRCDGKISPSNLKKKVWVDNPNFGTDPEVVYTEDMRMFEKNIYDCPHCKRETP
jgi:hypothetical protein